MALHMQRAFDRLKRKVLSLSALVEESLQKSVKALEERDGALARRIIDADVETDQKEVEVEEECLKILALHQPVAIDLRFIIAAIKINNDLERIGDLAVNIAERAEYLATQKRPDEPFDFAAMADRARSMLRRALDALVNMDACLAREVCADDDEVDAMNRQMYDQVKDAIHRRPEKVDALIHILSASRHLERVADHATNIAEDVIYMIEGEIVRHRSEDYINRRATR